MSKKLLDVSLSCFLIVCTVVIVLAAVKGQPLIQQYSESLAAQQQAVETLQSTIASISDEYLSLLKAQSHNQQAIVQNIERSNTILYEAGIAIGSRIMEQEGGMSPTDADAIINGSIEKINQIDDRLGTLAKALNDASRR